MVNIFLTYLGISATVGIVVLVILLASPFINRRYAAKWKYYIWIFLAIRLLIPVSGMYYKKSDSPVVNGTVWASGAAVYDPTEIQNVQPRRFVVEIPVAAAGQIAQMPDVNSGRPKLSLFDIAFTVWIAGALIFVAVPILSCLHYKYRITRGGERIKGGIFKTMQQLKSQLKIKRKVSLIRFGEAASPMIIGFIKPVLVLPCGEFSNEELQFIIRHELIHLRRGDVYIKLLCVLANAVHWFNPLIWIMRREAAIDMELSCDEGVIKGADFGVKMAYAETLMSSLRRQSSKRSSLTTQFYVGKGTMKKRFTNILGTGSKKNGIAVLICAVFLATFLGVMVGCTQKSSSPSGNEPSTLTDVNAGDDPSTLTNVNAGDDPSTPTNVNASDDVTALANEIFTNMEADYRTTVDILTMHMTEPINLVEGVDQLGNLREIDGVTYVPMVEDYDTIDEIMEVFGRVYTKEKCDTLYSRYLDINSTGFMKEADGKLYAMATGELGHTFFNAPITSAEQISETEILARTSVTYDFGDVPYEITFKYEDGKWKIAKLVEMISEEGRELSY